MKPLAERLSNCVQPHLSDRASHSREQLLRKAHVMLSVFERTRARYHLSYVFLVITLSGAHEQSYASPALDTLGALDSLTSLSAGVSGATSSAYFNPAGLAWPSSRSSFGVIGVSQHLSLSFQTPAAEHSVSQDIYRAAFLDPNIESTPLPSQDVRSRGLDRRASRQLFAQVGLTQPLWPRRLYLGVTALIPLHRFELQAPGYADERLQYFDNQMQFERWGARLEGLSAALALAWRINDWLGIGGGTSLSNHSVAQSAVFLSDASYQGLSLIAPRVEVKSSLSPYASISARYRGSPKNSDTSTEEPDKSSWGIQGFLGVFAPEEVRVDGSSAVKIWGYPYADGQDAILQTFTRHYRALPMRVRWGLRLDCDPQHLDMGQDHHQGQPRGDVRPLNRWSWVFGGQWSQWSNHVNQVGEPSGWVDQWELSSGVSRETLDLSWGADLRWRPTPIPHQSGRSSYVDPSQLALSLGARWPVSDQLSWQVSVQGHWLLPREDRKDPRALDPVRDEFPSAVDEITGEAIDSSKGLQTNNPGHPGYDSQGVVWSGGVSLVWRPSAQDD